MRLIKYLVVHCTATPVETRIESIQRYWKEVKQWNNPGYHYIIKRDGEIVQLQDEDRVANGVRGNNLHSIHISYIGGVDMAGNPIDNRTPEQVHAMFNKLVALSEKYPYAQILGHRDFPGVTKRCPSFDVREWLKNYVPDIGRAA